jgi:type II secretory pathway component GspD/PulD (secretin)
MAGEKSGLVRKAGEVRGEGFALAVAPVIAMEGARMNVAFSLSSPVGIDKVGLPIYSDQDVQAELTLEQGQTYKLGGIRRSVNTVEDKGFPVLKDIPVLKYLFANESRIIRESEVYVFLTPTWTAPQLPAMDAMQSEAPVMALKIENILKQNPNVAMSAKDAAILQQYFDTQKEEQ